MGWFSWFSKKQEGPEDYERVLAALSLSIQSKQTRLADLRLRERRATLLVTLYAIGGWVIYLALWFTFLPSWYIWKPRSQDEVTLQSIIKSIPAVVGPVVIVFIRQIVQAWYTRMAEREEKQLKSLMAEQRTKIDEIKKKTNYYTTKNLLDRYDEAATGRQAGPSTTDNTLRQRRPQASSGIPKSNHLQTPQTTPHRPPALQVFPPGSSTQMTSRQQLLQHTAPQPMPPARRQWYDKLADALLGDDEASGASQHSRYALICENCFSHNGLVRESDFDNMKFVCPKCGHFNPSPRMKRENPTPLTTAIPPFTPQRSPLSERTDGSVSPPPSSVLGDSPMRRSPRLPALDIRPEGDDRPTTDTDAAAGDLSQSQMEVDES